VLTNTVVTTIFSLCCCCCCCYYICFSLSFLSVGGYDLSPKLSTLQQRVQAISLHLYLKKIDHYIRWLKQDLSTLALSLSEDNAEYKKTGVPNPAWITSCSLQPRISLVRQSPWFKKMHIRQMLSGDADFGPLLSTLVGKNRIEGI
jgi:hypothetical protein